MDVNRCGGIHLWLPLVDAAYGMPRNSVTPVLFTAACPTMTPLVVDTLEAATAVSLLSTNGDACVRSGSNNVPTARVTLMIVTIDLKGQ